jgi:hypothetical protein
VRPALLGAAALATALSLGARPAEAHLMPARQGTINVVGAGVFVVLSVPASALHGADDDRDGVLSAEELDRHEAELRAEVDRRLVVLDGATVARTERVDMILSPEHDAKGGRADQIVVLKHAVLDAAPVDLRVRCDLFGGGAAERELKITATRHPEGGAETQVGVLTPEATERAFFPPPERAPGSVMLGAVGGVPRGFLVAGAVMALALGMARRRRGGTLEVAER